MRTRVLVAALSMLALSACIGGCRPGETPKGGPLNAGPYPECRSIVEWIRVKNADPEATVLKWGPRQEGAEEASTGKPTPVLIDVHYKATIGKVVDGRWSQTLRVTGQQISEETDRTAEP
jgi:hypothetical protein